MSKLSLKQLFQKGPSSIMFLFEFRNSITKRGIFKCYRLNIKHIHNQITVQLKTTVNKCKTFMQIKHIHKSYNKYQWILKKGTCSHGGHIVREELRMHGVATTAYQKTEYKTELRQQLQCT
jgi:hypothetical protein